MLIYLDIKIPHLKIAPLVGNLEVGNLEGIHVNDDHVDHPDHDLFSQVAQCAGCNVYEPWAAMVIGAGAAFVYLCIHTLMIR